MCGSFEDSISLMRPRNEAKSDGMVKMLWGPYRKINKGVISHLSSGVCAEARRQYDLVLRHRRETLGGLNAG